MAGHDVFDSTTVRDDFKPVQLDDDFSLQGLHIGIPMVRVLKSIQVLRQEYRICKLTISFWDCKICFLVMTMSRLGGMTFERC